MNFQFMRNRYTFYGLSISLIIVSLFLLAIKGLNYGIDFKGGSILHVRFVDESDENKVREVFKQIEKERKLYFTSDQIIVQSVSGGNNREFIIQYPAAPIDTADNAEIHDRILSDLKRLAPFSDDALEASNVGPTMGEEMKSQGIQAALLSVFGILIYLAWRFELQSASGAIIALIHDLVVVLGAVSLLGLEFDITVLAAILTLLGYSVNDSIVILDRIRENRKITKESDFAKVIDSSINQTLGRTINTSITTLLALFALLIIGGASIKGFATTLTIGCVVGTYSSIFIASTVLYEMTVRQNRSEE